MKKFTILLSLFILFAFATATLAGDPIVLTLKQFRDSLDTATGVNKLLNKKIKTSGWVVTKGDPTNPHMNPNSPSASTIQDHPTHPTACVTIWAPNSNPSATYGVGDSIEVIAWVMDYSGITEIGDSSSTKLATYNIPDPTKFAEAQPMEVPVAHLSEKGPGKRPYNGEPYEGCWIVIKNVHYFQAPGYPDPFAGPYNNVGSWTDPVNGRKDLRVTNDIDTVQTYLHTEHFATDTSTGYVGDFVGKTAPQGPINYEGILEQRDTSPPKDSGYRLSPIDFTNSIKNATAVSLSSFVALEKGNAIYLEWQSTDEYKDRGFDVYRSNERFGVYRKINTTPILSANGDYSYIDRDVKTDVVYYYKVKPVGMRGSEGSYGPVSASIQSVKSTFTQLDQNYPNPFNPSTEIGYAISNKSNVSLNIYNSVGQLVRTLVNGEKEAGYYKVHWDGKDNNGNAVPSGMYVYTLISGDKTIGKKMMLVK